jgi:hypothetical protein
MLRLSELGVTPQTPLWQVSLHVSEFIDMDRGNKSRLRRKMADAGFTDRSISTLLPSRRAEPVELWAGMSEPLRGHIAEAINSAALPQRARDWTVAKITAATDALVDFYKTPAGANTNLTKFRQYLRKIGVSDNMIQRTMRPEISAAVIENSNERHIERAEEGIEIPDAYRDVDGLAQRVVDFTTGSPATPQVLADLLVVLSARPSEADTLEGAMVDGVPVIVDGVLKKRGLEYEPFPIVSMLPAPLALEFLQAWRAAPEADKVAARRGLRPLVHSWGLQVRDLRAIGATQAVNVRRIGGRVRNEAAARAILRQALRHYGGPDAATRYQRVNG